MHLKLMYSILFAVLEDNCLLEAIRFDDDFNRACPSLVELPSILNESFCSYSHHPWRGVGKASQFIGRLASLFDLHTASA